MTQFGRSHINSVVQYSVNTAELLGFPRMLDGLLTGAYPDTDPPTSKKSEASIFLWKNDDGGGKGELSPTVCFSTELNQWLINGDRMDSYLVADGYDRRHV